MPEKPPEPEYEDVLALPDQAHLWDRDWDSDTHGGKHCSACDSMSACTWCHPKDLERFDCLREQADSRNDDLRSAHKKAMERYGH